MAEPFTITFGGEVYMRVQMSEGWSINSSEFNKQLRNKNIFCVCLNTGTVTPVENEKEVHLVETDGPISFLPAGFVESAAEYMKE